MAEQNFESLLEYVRTSRVPSTIFEIAADLANLGANGANWPRASAQIWKRDLEAAIAQGVLRLDENQCVRMPIAAASIKQLDLF
jgi:hypothetical protein